MLSAEEESATPDMLYLLNEIAAEWHQGVQLTSSLSRPPTPFHVPLHAVPGDVDRLQSQVAAAGLVAPVTTLEMDSRAIAGS